MQAIETRVLAVTNFKPTRIVATASGGARLVMSKSSAEDATAPGYRDDDVHRVVAQRLADKMGWTGKMHCGGTKQGYVFVFEE